MQILKIWLLLKGPNRNIVKLARYWDEDFVSTYSSFFAGPIDDKELSCYGEAIRVKECEHAMDEEVNILMKNETRDILFKPPDVYPILCKWIYKIKRWANICVDRYKVRLVAHGFSQKKMEKFMKRCLVRWLKWSLFVLY